MGPLFFLQKSGKRKKIGLGEGTIRNLNKFQIEQINVKSSWQGQCGNDIYPLHTDVYFFYDFFLVSENIYYPKFGHLILSILKLRLKDTNSEKGGGSGIKEPGAVRGF